MTVARNSRGFENCNRVLFKLQMALWRERARPLPFYRQNSNFGHLAACDLVKGRADVCMASSGPPFKILDRWHWKHRERTVSEVIENGFENHPWVAGPIIGGHVP